MVSVSVKVREAGQRGRRGGRFTLKQADLYPVAEERGATE